MFYCYRCHIGNEIIAGYSTSFCAVWVVGEPYVQKVNHFQTFICLHMADCVKSKELMVVIHSVSSYFILFFHCVEQIKTSFQLYFGTYCGQVCSVYVYYFLPFNNLLYFEKIIKLVL
jgi:hypothetical protein